MPQIDLTLIGLPDFFKSKSRVSDDEALSLYNVWASSPPGQDIVAEGATVRNLVTKGLLKPRGMQEGMSSKYQLTTEGRSILIEIVTNLQSKMKQNQELPRLSKIRSRAKRARQTFVKKASADSRPTVVVAVKGFDADKG